MRVSKLQRLLLGLLPCLALFLASPPASAQTTVIFGITNTVWRYDTNGTELHGTGWEQKNFNDSNWPQGRAVLGLEPNFANQALIGTRFSLFHPGSTTVRVTSYWFRVHFNLPENPIALGSALTLSSSNYIDDGYVMYLNGVEIDRYNMPGVPGTPDVFYTTMATAANPAGDTTPVNRTLGTGATLPSLMQGDNVLAVEVHQSGNTSSDVTWGMELRKGISSPPQCVDPSQPRDTNVLQGRAFTLVGTQTGTPAPTYQWFKNGVAIPGATGPTLTIPSATLGDAGIYEVEATNPAGVNRCHQAMVTVTPDTQGPRVVSVTADPRGTNVVVVFDEPIDPSQASLDIFSIFIDGQFVRGVSAVNATTINVEPDLALQPLPQCVPHTLSLGEVKDPYGNLIAPNPTVATFRVPLLLLAIDDLHQWRYDQSGTDLGIAWRTPGYDDSAWPSGPALLALEGGGLPEPIRTPLTVGTNKPTFYFRTHFTLPVDPSSVTRLRLRQVLDDGAIFYLNGTEVSRTRIALGPLDFNTLAANQPVDPAQYEGPFDLPLTALLGGDNVLAVEVHQSSFGSTDIVLGAELIAEISECKPLRPRFQIVDFFPHEGGEGTLLTIVGGPFHGGNPDDHCAVLMKGNRFIDIEVLTATATELVARVGVIPPNCVGPLQLMVGVGDGARTTICPIAQDVKVADGTWIWRGDAANGAVAQQPFIALTAQPAGPAGAALMNFHSGGPAAGMLTVTLDKDWGIGSRFCINARVHAQGTGADTRLGATTFTGNGNRFDCAIRICDLLVKAFASHPQRPLTIVCAVLTNGANAVVKITLPGGQPIDGGNIDILQKSPPPIITGLWDIQNAGLWRREIRKHEVARWYRCYEWRTINSIWFERRAEGLWITRQALETFTCQSHCIYRFPNGRVWVIWRTFQRQDLVRFWAHYRFWWPGRVNPLLPVNDPAANRTMMSMDDLQIVLPMTPRDPNPATPFNEGVMIVDENGQQHFQGQPGFEVMPDIAANPNGFQLAGTAQSTTQLPPAADRIQDLPMQPMPGMAQLQPGVIIQWLVDKNGNVLIDHNNDGWPDPLTSPDVLGGQKHQGLIAAPTGVAGNVLPVDQGNNQLQLQCWELAPNGEVLGAMPGQTVAGPPVDLNGDGLADNPIGGPVPADPTVRQINVVPGGVQEVLDPTAKAVDIAVVEEAAPTDAQLAAMNANLAAQIPGFVPLQRPFILCINRIWVRRLWTVDRRYVFDTWLHHWAWQHRNHIILRHKACRVWLTKVSVSSFSYAQHCYPFGLPPTWRMASLTDVRFLRVCYRIIYIGPNQISVKIDQMHLTVPSDPNNPNSPLMLLSTSGDENKLFQEVPPAVLAGLQPDPLPVGPDGVFVEPIDPVAGTLDIGPCGTGVFGNRPLEARGMLPAMLGGNDEDPLAPKNNQLQLYCWALNPNGTIAQETFATAAGFGPAGAPITLAVTPAPALPSFVDENGNAMENPTMFTATLTGEDNTVNIVRNAGGTATLSWAGAGQLQAADALVGNGPPTVWTDVAGGALSPVTVNINLMKKFYRVRR